MKIHEKYLSRCLQIAENGLGTTAPNPMVGAVLTHGGRIIGEGFTSPYGGPHAEVRAIRSVREPALLKEATLYVSLEPCCHHGKTPPCTDLILEVGIPRVVVGTRDPHEKVAGQGIARLREGGCDVLEGILEPECREHHRRFITFHEKKRPYVILKWAQSADGFIAPDPGKRDRDPKPYWISGPAALRLAHQWRSQEPAILVGTRTALEDNPALTTRLWHGANPLRILIDRNLEVPRASRIYGPEAHTLVFCAPDRVRHPHGNVRYRALEPGEHAVPGILRALWEEGVLSLIVEGGARTLERFIRSGLWDEARIIEGPARLGQGLPAPHPDGRLVKTTRAGGDRIQILRHD